MKTFRDARSDIAWTSYGDPSRPPLIMLHSLAMDRTMWTSETIDLFGTDHHLVLCDLPGHGDSPLNGSATMEAIADRIADLLRSIAAERFSVVGVSLGGCVAQALTIRHPDRVRALGLVDTTSSYHDPDAWSARARKARDDGFASLAGFQASRWFTEAFRTREPHQITRLLSIFERTRIDDYEVICAAMGQFDATDRLPEISCPTSVVVGVDDYATPVAHAQILAEKIPGASLTVVEAASHLAILEQPRAVFDALAAALRR